MKDRVKHIGALILTAIYCYAVSVVANVPLSSDFGNKLSTEQEHYFAVTSHNLISHTADPEFSVDNTNSFPSSDIQDFSDESHSLTGSIESQIDAEFNQYCNNSVNFLIQQRKTDLLFPFHFFW